MQAKPYTRYTIGDRIGQIEIISVEGIAAYGRKRYRLKCDCGKTWDTVVPYKLRLGNITDCGCISGNHRCDLHGASDTAEYGVWRGMKSRCQNPKSTNYDNYGGRGIKVCDRWQSFRNFFTDMGPRPTRQHQIDRIQNHLDYTPENCMWTTRDIQNRNTRKSLMLTLNGVTKSAPEWAEITGMNQSTIRNRKFRGWTDEQILKTPLRRVASSAA